MLEALPSRDRNMIYKRANGFDIHRAVVSEDEVPYTLIVKDPAVIPGPKLLMRS